MNLEEWFAWYWINMYMIVDEKNLFHKNKQKIAKTWAQARDWQQAR